MWSGTVPVSRARTLSFQKNHHFIFHALVALKRLVSLLGRLVACSARIVVDRHTHIDTQNDYRNPRCACAPRVNESTKSSMYSNSMQMSSTGTFIHMHGSVLLLCPGLLARLNCTLA